jgi:hypothetical protein
MANASRDILEKLAVGIAPQSRPANFQPIYAKNLLDQGDVHAIEIDLSVPQAAFIFSPVIP